MTPKQAKQLLQCSYPTLTSYANRGILKATRHPVSKHMIYNDQSVLELYSKISTASSCSKVIICAHNHMQEFEATDEQLSRIASILEGDAS